MKPRIKLAETDALPGGIMALYEHDGAFVVNFAGQELMHSEAVASEQALGRLGVKRLSGDGDSQVLIGGLGLGFTLASALDACGPETKFEVVELLPDMVDWNRTHLKDLNGARLHDPRVTVTIDDANRVIRKAKPQTYDAILLDVDNGPSAMVSGTNSSLYSISGLRALRTAVKSGGRVAIWSAGAEPAFENRLKREGMKFESVPALKYPKARRAAYVIYVIDPRG
jgi:spermidine synthase